MKSEAAILTKNEREEDRGGKGKGGNEKESKEMKRGTREEGR